MRFRGKSIRRKIVALLLVPLLSLTAIWAFATALTGREAQALFDVSNVVEKVGYPTEDTVRVLQQERRQTLVYLADPRASDALTALRRSRSATDKVVAELRRSSKSMGLREDMDRAPRSASPRSWRPWTDRVAAPQRRGRHGQAFQALDLYNRLVDPCFTLLAICRPSTT